MFEILIGKPGEGYTEPVTAMQLPDGTRYIAEGVVGSVIRKENPNDKRHVRNLHLLSHGASRVQTEPTNGSIDV